jgi:hypothetical protein
MKIDEIYKEFTGYMENCKGKDCSNPCCFFASEKGVDVYPDEVIYFAKKFGKNFPAKIIRSKDSETGFKMFGCLDDYCLLANEKPIICRGFPIKPFSLESGHQKIQISEDCSMCNELSQDYVQRSYCLWDKVYSDRFRNSFIKRWIAFYYLKKLS